MAIDPSIALAVRPVQIPQFNIQSPVDRLAQVLSLRNLMTQGQLGQLGLQEKTLQLQLLQQGAQERANLAGLFGQPQTQSPAATQPVPSGAYQEPNLMRPAGPEGRAPVTTAPDQTIPLQTAPFGLTGGPESVPGLANVGALPSPPPGAPLSALMTPQAQAAPAVTAPAATPPAAPTPAAAGPAMGAATVADPFASLPSYSDILRAAPTTGAAHIETISKAKKAYYDDLTEKAKAQQEQWDGLSRIAAGVHDEPSKFAGIAQAFTEGRITAAVRDQLLSHPYNKEEWDRFQTQALEGSKRLDEVRAQINQKAVEDKNAFEATLRPSQLTEAQAKATEATAKAKTATYGSVAQDAALPTDQASWDTFRAGVPDPLRSKIATTYSPAAQQQTVKVLGQTPDQQVTAAETAKQHGLENVFRAVDTRITQQKNAREENIYQQTYGDGANQALVGVEPKLRSQVSREVSKLNDDYLKAQATADQFQSVLDMAKAGNKAAGSNLPLIGVETLNAINGIKRINRSEIDQYKGAGSLYDNIMGKIGKLTTGDPIPADVLKDIEAMHNTLRQNSDSEYRSKLQSKNDIYHSNFQPVGKTGAVTPDVQRALSNQAPGIHQLGDGSVWLKNADGSIQPTTAPKQ